MSRGQISASSRWVLPALLVLAVLAAYVPAYSAGFIWDDDDYVTQNPVLATWGGLYSIWLEPLSLPQYYPLVHTTFWLEYRLWGLEPLGYHLVNVALHAANALLLFGVLRRLAVPGALFAAALFALHPIQVESVAWITERKNVLSALFFLLALRAFLTYWPLESDAPRGARRYASFTAIAFLAALLSKTVACAFPAVLLVLRGWKRGRLDRRFTAATLPLFALGIAFAGVTIYLEKHLVRAEGWAWDHSFAARTVIAARALFFYAGKLLWPLDLCFNYERWEIDATSAQILYPLAALALFVALFAARGRIGRAPLCAALLFGGLLVPALGFVDVYPMRYAFVADHFAYHASAAGCAAIAAAATRALRAAKAKVRVAAAGASLAVLGGLSFAQARSYADLETLWNDTLARNPRSFLAHLNLGTMCLHAQRLPEALRHLELALALDPQAPEVHSNLGIARYAEGRSDLAEQHFRRAAELAPQKALHLTNLAKLAFDRQDLDGARRLYERALELEPDDLGALGGLGTVLRSSNQPDEALRLFERVLSIDPDRWRTHVEAAIACRMLGRFGAASVHARSALALAPNDPAALAELRAAEQGR